MNSLSAVRTAGRALSVALLLVLAAPGFCPPAAAHGGKSATSSRLPVIGPAPPFSLIAQSGDRLSLHDLAGKVVAINFIYTRCSDSCPIVTAKMAMLQRELGRDLATGVHFVSITVEPEVDTPQVLAAYARSHGADLAGWSFVTGQPRDVAAVVQHYGGFARRAGAGRVDHLFLTSLVDRQGRLRVQYLGHQFKVTEMRADLHALARE